VRDIWCSCFCLIPIRVVRKNAAASGILASMYSFVFSSIILWWSCQQQCRSYDRDTGFVPGHVGTAYKAYNQINGEQGYSIQKNRI
jgi:hypothetical protein